MLYGLSGPLELHKGLLQESQRAEQPSLFTFTHSLGSLPLRLVKRVPALAFTRTGTKILEGRLSTMTYLPIPGDLATLHYTSSLTSRMTCLCIRGWPTLGGLVCLVRPALLLHVVCGSALPRKHQAARVGFLPHSLSWHLIHGP